MNPYLCIYVCIYLGICRQICISLYGCMYVNGPEGVYVCRRTSMSVLCVCIIYVCMYTFKYFYI